MNETQKPTDIILENFGILVFVSMISQMINSLNKWDIAIEYFHDSCQVIISSKLISLSSGVDVDSQILQYFSFEYAIL